MSKQEKIAEINTAIQKNKEKSDTYRQYLSDLLREEQSFYTESQHRLEEIWRLSELVGGNSLAKIQSEALTTLENQQRIVKQALRDELGQINENLRRLDSERDDLSYTKRKIEEEK